MMAFSPSALCEEVARLNIQVASLQSTVEDLKRRLQRAELASYCYSPNQGPDQGPGSLLHFSAVLTSCSAPADIENLGTVYDKTTEVVGAVQHFEPVENGGLGEQDKRRSLVAEWDRLHALVAQFEEAAAMTNALNVVEPLVNVLNSIQTPVEYHRRLVRLQEETGETDPEKLLLSFLKGSLSPALELRNKLDFQASEDTRMATIPAVFDQNARLKQQDEVEKHRTLCIEASKKLRNDYDLMIPLLRFGYPNLRTRIWEEVDQLCGLGALRLDLKPSDFTFQPLPGWPGCLTAQPTEEAHREKALQEEYFVKEFPAVDDFYRELEVFRLVANGAVPSNIASLEFAFERNSDPKIYYVAIPKYTQPATTWFATRRTNPANAASLLRALKDIVLGVACLHSHDIVHCCINPNAILMDGVGNNATPKLMDFTFAQLPPAPSTVMSIDATSPHIPTIFCPPEFVEHDGSTSSRLAPADVFSLGHTFDALLPSEDRLQLFQGKEDVATRFCELITLMTDRNPECRLPLTQDSELSTLGWSVLRRLSHLMSLCEDEV